MDHFCLEQPRFENYQSIKPEPITAASGGIFTVIGRGDVCLLLPNRSSLTTVVLKNAIHAPRMVFTLISIGQLDDAGCTALFGHGTCALKGPDQKFITQVKKTKGLYHAATKALTQPALRMNMAAHKMSLAEAHHVLGHISYKAVKHAIRSGQVSGIQINNNAKAFCNACTKAKPQNKPFPDYTKNCVRNFGDCIHTDLWGPASVESLGKARYSVDFTNDAMRWTKIRFIHNKD
jgi:hypothetical protein